jgi:pimeloyl-ACP methyl ester carboxylesterase/predicted glycosyltransferase
LVGRTTKELGLRAREPEETGFIERNGVRVYWERLGEGERTILFLPTWSLIHSRHWKFQLPYFARHFRVLTFDGRGNGRSDRPPEPTAYAESEFAADAVAVLDATGTDRASIVGFSMGGQRGLLLAANHPERVDAAAFIGPAVPLAPPHSFRVEHDFDEQLDTDEGWAKYNRHYWLRDYPGFAQFFLGQMFPEPHSTKQIEDGVKWALETTGEILVATQDASGIADEAAARELCERVRCPVLVIHGDRDRQVPHARGAALAEATGGTLVTLEGSGHAPHLRDPVKVNLLLRDFLGGGEPPRERRIVCALRRRHPRALYVSSPIGLGHAQRDLAIARELRALRPDLEIVWLAQHPVTQVLEAAGETVHPASKLMANESAHIESEMGEHDLHVFQAWREMDEILLANFMLFHDVVRDDRYDLWLGDESWELDYYLHENPELKTAPYVFMTDFVGWLPIDDGPGSHEASVAADYNHENIRHIERYPYVRDGAVFIGSKDDVVPRHFGPELPFMPDWIERHFAFPGYVLPFDPADYADTERLRHELGHDPNRPLLVASVGGSGVGVHLLRRIAAAFAELRKDVPEARLLLVCGPRIDPAAIEPVEGMEAVGYVHDLFRTLACCDLAVVQGGLTTTMELVANRRPFVYIPLRNHFEQNHHVVHRLRRYGAPEPTLYEDATPRRLAAQMLERLGAPVEYAPVESDGAARAAQLIAPLLEERKGSRERSLDAAPA